MAKFSAWCPGLEAALAEPFPAALVQQKKLKGSSISFVAWHVYVHRLNDLVGSGWSMGEPILKEVGGKLVMGISLTILGVTRINFGSEDEEHGNAGEDGVVRDFGSAETNAFAQSFKRTCALFGLGLGMYDKTGAVAKWRNAEVRTAQAAVPKLGGSGPHKDTPLVDCPDSVLMEARDALLDMKEKGTLKPAHAEKLAAIQGVLAARDEADAASLTGGGET